MNEENDIKEVGEDFEGYGQAFGIYFNVLGFQINDLMYVLNSFFSCFDERIVGDYKLLDVYCRILGKRWWWFVLG